MGIGAYLVLRGSEDAELEGNYFLDKILGANIKFISKEEYSNNRTEIMEEIKDKLKAEGHNAYILPEGASNGIGSLGYVNAMEEIIKQENEMDIEFNAIVLPVGSGGTYAGLYYKNHLESRDGKIYGVNVCDNSEHFKRVILGLIDEISEYTSEKIDVKKDDINIIDGYVGNGYALSTKEEIEFLGYIAKLEGLVLDPVYTGKAMRGLVEEIKRENFKDVENILFIHTGGIFGWNSYARGLL